MTDYKSITRSDGFENAVTGLGNINSDKGAVGNVRFSSFGVIDDTTLERMYDEDDLAYKIIAKLPEAAFRAPISVESDAELGDNKGDYGAQIEETLEAIGVHKMLMEAAQWGRLFGGGVILMRDVDGYGPEYPLQLERALPKLTAKSFLVLDKRDFTRNHNEFGEPDEYYSMNSTQGRTLIHESRMCGFGGATATVRVRRRNGFWDNSVILRCRNALTQFASQWQSVASMMHDMSQGVLKINDYHNLITQGFKDQLEARLEIASLARFVGNVFPIDTTEEFSYTERSFSGVPELLDRSMYAMSAASEIPATLLFGRSPAGMNATGESDLTNWYDVVASKQQQDYGPQYNRIVRLVAHSLGVPEPDTWRVAWEPLWSPTEKEIAETRKIYADIDVSYINAGVLDPNEVAAARFVGGWSDSAPEPDMALREAQPRDLDAEEPEQPTEDDTGDLEGSGDPEREDRLDAAIDYLPPEIRETLHALIVMHRVKAPMPLRAVSLAKLSRSLGIATTDILDDISLWSGDPITATFPRVSEDRNDYNDLSSFLMTDLVCLEELTGIDAPQSILRALATRIAGHLQIADDEMIQALQAGVYELRRAERSLSLFIREETK